VLLLVSLVSGACARSSGESRPSSNEKRTKQARVAIAAAKLDAGQSSRPAAEGGGTSQGETAEQWVQTAPRSLYPGMVRHGPTQVISVVRDRATSIELPRTIGDRCWVAAVARDAGESEVRFDLVDSMGHLHPFGQLSGQRTLLPAEGPFCSLTGDLVTIAVRATRDVSVVFRVAWFAYPSPPARDSL
jgi:hypothetical protein